MDSLGAFDTVRAIRQSTKEKTVDSDVARQKAFKIKIRSRPPLKHQFSQKELLLDALETEVRVRGSTLSSSVCTSPLSLILSGRKVI